MSPAGGAPGRGPHPRDARLFAPALLDTLRRATADLSWLRARGYGDPSALQLVGNRYSLVARQRRAVDRCAASDDEVAARAVRAQDPAAVAGQPVAVDAFNQLITLETALGGGPVLRGRDGFLRDLAGVHGTWRRARATATAIERLTDALDTLRPASVHWAIDQPVSNSGRLAALLRDAAGPRPWHVEVTRDVDPRLMASDAIVATSDSRILDHAPRTLNLLALAIPPDTWLLDLG